MELLFYVVVLVIIIYSYYYVIKGSSVQRSKTKYLSNLNELVDPKGFYNEMRLEQVSLYQLKFNELLNLVGVDSDENDADLDEDEIDEITADASNAHNLNPIYLKVMLLQYLYADPIERRIYNREQDWVKIVTGLTLNTTEKTTFYPSAWSIFATHFENA